MFQSIIAEAILAKQAVFISDSIASTSDFAHPNGNFFQTDFLTIGSLSDKLYY